MKFQNLKMGEKNTCFTGGLVVFPESPISLKTRTNEQLFRVHFEQKTPLRRFWL
jgi:hypothetical protein